MKLFRKQHEPSCQTCENARMTADNAYVLCLHQGITQPFDHCKKYRYSPLKRVPARNRVPQTYHEDDFSV